MKGALNVTAAFLFLISACIWLVTVIAVPLFAAWAHFMNLAHVAGMSFATLMHNFLVLMAYLYSPWQKVVMMPNFVSSTAGATHFADVQHLFVFNLVVLLVTAIPAVRFLGRLFRERRMYVLWRQALWGIFIPIIAAVAMAFNFNAVFIGFHKLLFRNSDWLFDPRTDPVINVLPESYFAACFVLFIVMFLGIMAFILYRARRDAVDG